MRGTLPSRLATTASTIAIGMLVGLSAAPALANEAQPEDDTDNSEVQEEQDSGVGDIVVTATRREAALQNIGVSVSAFTGETLRDRNVISTEDLTSVTPGLSLIQAGGAPLAGLIAIRGVAQNDFAAHLESANVLYVDDVYRPSNSGNLQNLFDVERVEVLKGPQGTLFGRNATGGLIHIITADPTFDLEGYGEITIAEFNQIQAQGAINIPLGDLAAMRVAFFANSNDGWIRNAIGPDQLEDDTVAVRAKVLMEPTDSLSIKIQGEWSDNESDAAGGGFGTGGFPDPVTGLGQFRDPPAPLDTGYVDADGSPFTGEFDLPGFFDRRQLALIGEVQYQTGNFTFTSITAWSDLDTQYEEDNDLSPFDITIFRQNTVQENFSQELRVDADYDNLRLTGGFYYLNIDGDYFQGFQINNLGNFFGAFPFLPPDTLLFPLGQNQFANYSLETDSWSLFGQGEIDLSDQLTLTAGIRYTRDSKDFAYLNTCVDVTGAGFACAPPDPATLAGGGLITDSSSEDGISARLQLDYQATPDWLLFASYNRGYKAFNYNAGFAGAALVENVRFDGEQLNAFEVGSKLDIGNIARFNASAFYYDYNDYQAFDQQGTSFILSNADAEIYGLDAELTLSPGAGFDVFLGAAFVDTTVFDIPIAGVLTDVEAPQAADFQFNFGVSKEVDFDFGTFKLGFDGNYTGDYFSQLNNAPVTAAGDNWLVNTRLSFTPPSEGWEASLFVRNLFDEERLLYAFDITFPGSGLVEQVFGQPRWIGGTLRVNF